jgi:hypothetical protein
MRLGEWQLKIWFKELIVQYEVWSWAMVVELNQHYNSKDRIFGWDEFIFYSSSTIAIWIYMN